MNRLREVRRAAGETQRGLTARTRVFVAVMGVIERSRYVPTPDPQARLPARLGVTVETVWPPEPAATATTTREEAAAPLPRPAAVRSSSTSSSTWLRASRRNPYSRRYVGIVSVS